MNKQVPSLCFRSFICIRDIFHSSKEMTTTSTSKILSKPISLHIIDIGDLSKSLLHLSYKMLYTRALFYIINMINIFDAYKTRSVTHKCMASYL